MNLNKLSTYKIGGPTKHFLYCKAIIDLQNVTAWSQSKNEPWFLLGNGSNILVSDEGFPGVVIKLDGDFKKVVFDEDTIQAGGGVLLPALSRHCLSRGWGGFEFMCGIPGTIGGAIRMNAGTKQGEIKDHFVSATVLAPDGKIKKLLKNDLAFSHRHSMLADSRDIVLSAIFAKSYTSNKAEIKKKIKEIIAARKQKQPRNKKNCGSVFKAPPGRKPAGWYIDQAGLKGFQVGDAMVANEHANWIVNLGNATAKDIKAVISHVQNVVFKKFGIMLEREVIYVPEDVL